MKLRSGQGITTITMEWCASHLEGFLCFANLKLRKRLATLMNKDLICFFQTNTIKCDPFVFTWASLPPLMCKNVKARPKLNSRQQREVLYFAYSYDYSSKGQKEEGEKKNIHVNAVVL